MYDYKIRINTKNRMINVNGRMVRSPVEFGIQKIKLNFYKNMFRSLSITDYSIENYTESKPKIKKDNPKPLQTKNKKVSLRKGNKTLDKYLEN